MNKFEKYITIEGDYFDCQLTGRQLLLWDMDGSLSFYDFVDIVQLQKQFPDRVPERWFKGLVQNKYDVPGKALPSDTSIMDGKLYTASEYGLFTGVARHSQLWDARLFKLQKNSTSPILAMAGGDDGLFELNASLLPSRGMSLAERGTKDIYRVSDKASHYTSYIGYNLFGSSSESEFVALFSQQKKMREYIREVDVNEAITPIVPEGFTLDNGIVYKFENDNLSFSQPSKGPNEEAIITYNTGEELFGEIVEVTADELHANFEFDNGLLILDNSTELLRITEPVTRWRTFKTNNKTKEWLLVLLDDRLEMYYRSLEQIKPNTNVPKEPKKEEPKLRSNDLIKQIFGSEKTIRDGKLACNILNAVIKRFGGGVNIDFLDLDNWDRLERVLFDKNTNLMYLVKNKPILFEDQAHEESYRMVFGNVDVFAMVVRFNELRIIEHRGYPFISVKTSSVFPSVVKNSLQRIVGEVIEQKGSMYGNDYGVKRNERSWYVRCLNGNFTSAVILGKDIDWRAEDSARLLMLENLDSIRKNVWATTVTVSQGIAKRLFARDRKLLTRIDNALYRNYKDLMKLDLAVRDVFYGQFFCERYSNDDFETMDVIEEYRGGDIAMVRETKSTLDFLPYASTIDQYREFHERLKDLMLIYISHIETDIINKLKR